MGVPAVSKHFYLTTAIDYINGAPHLGHAYEKIGADALVRYKQLTGYDTWFVVGSDEHSINILTKAESLGRDPREFCDEMSQVFKDAFAKLGIGYSIYARTSSEANVRRRRHLSSAATTAATSTRAPTTAGTAPPAIASTNRRSCCSRTTAAPSTSAPPRSWTSPITSSSCPRSRIACWITTPSTPTGSNPSRASTRC